MIALACALLLAAPPANGGLTELPNLDVLIDDKGFVADGGPLAGNNSVFLPLASLVERLTDGKGKVVPAAGKVEIRVGDRTIARLPVTGAGEALESVAKGELLYPVQRQLPLEDPPVMVNGTIYASVDSVAPIFGTSYQFESERLRFYSPRYWASKLDIFKGLESINTSMAGRYLDFGISPPASSLLIWARPDRPAKVQIYGLNNPPPFDRTPQPLLFSLDGHPVDVSDSENGAEAAPRTGGPDQTVRVITAPQPPGKVARYVALMVYKDLPAGTDAIDAINNGVLRPGEWGIVGLQQTVQTMAMRFEVATMGGEASFSSFAAHHDMPEALLREINGLTPADKPSKDRRLVVMGPSIYNPAAVEVPDAKPYEVKAGQTIDKLVQGWGISRDDFLKSNPSYGSGRELTRGEIVFRPAVAQGENPSSTVKADGRSYVSVRASNLYAASDTASGKTGVLPANTIVTASETVGSMARITFGRRPSYVAMADLRLSADASPQPPGTKNDPNFAPLPPGTYDPVPANRLARVALSMLGAPYHLGGSSLQSGIDCSNFVALAFSRAHLPVPPPPVTSQELVGTIVHVNRLPAVVRVGNRRVVESLPSPKDFPYGATSLSALRRGDRIIIQRDPLGLAPGSRHTGIYLGNVKVGDRIYSHAVINASSHRGVVVDEITASWIWEDYRYSVRSDLSGRRVAFNP